MVFEDIQRYSTVSDKFLDDIRSHVDDVWPRNVQKQLSIICHWTTKDEYGDVEDEAMKNMDLLGQSIETEILLPIIFKIIHQVPRASRMA